MKIISGTFHGRSLYMPTRGDVRPTSAKLREQVMNICQQSIEDAVVLDLFAGSGAIGFEALSRGASYCMFVEKERTVAATLHRNVATLQLETRCRILVLDALRAVETLGHHAPFSLVYLDPPYDATQLLVEALSAVDSRLPLEKDAYIFVEMGKRFHLPEVKMTRLSLESSRNSGDSKLLVFRH